MKRPSARSSRCSRRRTSSGAQDAPAAGPRISGRSALGLFVIAAVIASAFVVIPFASSANPDINGFELDGNVVHDAPRAAGRLGDAVQRGRSVDRGRQRTRTVFVADGIGPQTPASPAGLEGHERHPELGLERRGHPAKDDIANAYAAAYVEEGQPIIYFGQERVDTQAGDANMGFWFLQDPTVGPSASGKFDGQHVDGDVLIQSSLTNGGGVSDIHVFKWAGGRAQRGHRPRPRAGASAASSAR